MARQATRSDAETTDSGWPTTPLEVRREGGAAAETTISNDTLVIYDFDFAADLPTTLTVTGVAIHIDAKKTDSGGTSLIRLGAEISWNSGSTWTTPVRTTPLLTSSYGIFILGSPDDLWGHSWTRTELLSGNIRVRLTASLDSVTGTPTWHIRYARPTFFYDATGTTTWPITDVIALDEVVVINPTVVRVLENIDIQDSGSKPGGLTKVRVRPIQQMKLAGTAVTSLFTSSGFSVTATRPAKREAIGCRIRSTAIGIDIFIGDAILTTLSASVSYPMNHFQPGLLELGEVSNEADTNGRVSASTCSVRLANKSYVNQYAGSTTTEKLGKIFQNKAITGGALTVWAMSESSESWEQRIVFDGSIEEIEFDESATILHGVGFGTSSVPVPDIFVDEDLFSYEPGSSGVDTGEEVSGNRSKVVPIGLGRFDYGAVRPPAEFSAGHPLRVNFQAGPPTEDQKVYAAAALFPCMFGLKHPMMPTIHVARRYRRVNANGSSDSKFVSFPFQNVLLYGSRKSSPALPVALAPNGNLFHAQTQRFPNLGVADSTTIPSVNHGTYHLCFTWVQDAARSVGSPVIIPNLYQFCEAPPISVPTWILRHNGAGFMERLGYPVQLTASDWTDGMAAGAYGIFFNSSIPDISTLEPLVTRWPGVWQAIALPMEGPTKITKTTRIGFGETLRTNDWGNSARGTGNGEVENAAACRNLADLESFTRIHNLGRVSMQCPVSASSLGKIRGVRICMLWDNASSTAQNVFLFARFGPTTNYAIMNDVSGVTGESEYNKDMGALHNQSEYTDGFPSGTPVPCMKLFNVAATPFASFWMLPDFDPTTGKPFTLFDDSTTTHDTEPKKRYLPRKGRSPWTFTSMDLYSEGANVYQEYPWDFQIRVRDLSGGLPINGRHLDVYAVWMEVVYESPINAQTNALIVPTFAAAHANLPRRWHFPPPFVPGPPGSDVAFSFQSGAIQESSASGIYVTGKGAVDDASGTITGTAGRIIEQPSHIARALIRHYAGDSVFVNMAMGSDFGSLATAAAQLGSAYRMTIVVQEAETLGAVLRRIASQCHSTIVEQLHESGYVIWRMFADSDPGDIGTERQYRNSIGGFAWTLDHMAEATLNATITPIEEMASTVVVQYGLHIPTGTFSDEKFVSPQASNFSTDSSAYQTAMSDCLRDFGTTRKVTIQAPDIWDPDVAEMLCKWHADQLRQRLVTVEFETFANAMDLQCGHVILFETEANAGNTAVDARIPYPGNALSWAAAGMFNVVQTSMRKDSGQLARVFVRAREIARWAV